MLAKLLKYEIPAMGRKLVPQYIAIIVTSLVLGMAIPFPGGEGEGFFMALVGILYGGLLVSIMVTTIIMMIQRYNKSLLGDEAYFNQVLPVSAAKHISSKLISNLLWLLVTFIVMLISGLVIAAVGLTVGGLPNAEMGEFNFGIPKEYWGITLKMTILIIASIIKFIMQVYAAITIGHQTDNHTTMASVGAYIAILIAESLVGRIFMSLMPSSLRQEYLMENGVNLGSGVLNISSVFYTSLIMTIAIAAAYFFICKYLMEKKLNLN